MKKLPVANRRWIFSTASSPLFCLTADLAATYFQLITLSALANTFGEIVRSIRFAVFNLVLTGEAVIEFLLGGVIMRYSVLLEPINEPEFQGYYYAHVPTLDLTTHGHGIEGAIAAAQELIEAWIGEKRARGEGVPIEAKSLVAQVEIPDAVLRS